MAMPDLAPTVTFVMPILGKQEFLVEQINAVFKFSDQYRGFCELIVVVDEAAKEAEAVSRVVELAVKLNRVAHPHVRARVLHCMASLSFNESVEMALAHSLGDKIMIVANGKLDRFDPSKSWSIGIGQKDVIVADYFLNGSMLDELLAKK